MQAASQSFPETSWTTVLQAGKHDEDSVAERAARERLFTRYWMPVYSYLRRRGLTHSDAEDQTQAFFTRFIATEGLASADPARGRFRTFLLRCVSNHLANSREQATAGRRDVRLNLEIDALSVGEAEQLLALDGLGPDEVFDLAWARQKLVDALEIVCREWEQRERAAVFSALRRYLFHSPEVGGYAQISKVISLSPGAVKVEIFRLRRRLREVFRELIAASVTQVEETEDEVRYLLNLLVKNGVLEVLENTPDASV